MDFEEIMYALDTSKNKTRPTGSSTGGMFNNRLGLERG